MTSGFSDQGPRLGIWTLLFGGLALATTMQAAGVFGMDEHKSWIWSTITAGVGAGTAGITAAWIGTLVRSADPNYVSGMGSFLAFIAGILILASSSPVLKEFRRERIFDDSINLTSKTIDLAETEAPVSELV